MVLLRFYFGVVVAFLILPILVIIPVSFTGGDILQFPPADVGLRWYRVFFADWGWLSAVGTSVKIAVLASITATIVGTMAVVALQRSASRLAEVVVYFISAPLIIPHVFIAVGVFILAVRVGMTNSEMMLVGAHATITVPFVVLIVGAAARQLDPTIEQAARVLGAGPVRAFCSVTLPSLLPAILAGAMLSFFVSFDELIIAEFLLAGKETLPMRIWADVRLEVSPTVAAVSSLLIVVTTVGIGAVAYFRQRVGEIT